MLQSILAKFNTKGFSFKTIDHILQKLKLPQTFFKKFKISQILKSTMNFYDNCLDYKGVTALLKKSCESGFPYCFITASQSYFVDEARCLILASSQRKLHEYNKFKNVDVTIKKIKI